MQWCMGRDMTQGLRLADIHFGCDQAALRATLSVRLSVTPFFTMFLSSYRQFEFTDGYEMLHKT